MAKPHWGMGPVSEPLQPLLWGRHLRYAALAVLCLARRPLGVAELLERLEGQGFTVVGRRPAKTLADALGHEVATGRLCRKARGEYRIGQIAPRTRCRILARWRRSTPLPNLSPMASDERRTDSGIEIRPVYTAGDLEGWDPAARLGLPGTYPYTRGVYPTMYRGRPWTMRQYSGFGTAAETNQRWKMLLANGSTGLSCAFDLPTQMGYDSDHPRADGEVGKVGVAIDSIEDMRLLLEGLPLDQITTSMTINATAAILLLLYQLVAEEQGVAPAQLGGTIQNDILKEYIARGTYIYPPRPSMRLVTDIFGYCREYLPSWNTISISGYHIREAGSTAVQEIAFTLANGIAYVQAAVDAGLSVDEFAPRLSFFWNAHNNFFEEVAKFRAARRMWAEIMTERFGAKNDSSKLLRFHTQTGGSTLTAQQPENNIVRVTLQSLAAVLGGTQSLHTNGYDEAIGLPTERAARMALRTQQIIGAESGVVDTADPLAGSYFVEALTEQVEARTREYLEKIDGMGGAVAAIEAGFPQDEIEQAAYVYTKAVDAGDKVIVGVNKYVDEDPGSVEVFPIDPAMQAQQAERVKRLRAQRDQAAVDAALAEVAAAARGTQNLLLPMKQALRRQATLGEVSDVLREVFGVYQPTR
jgi:methylmalonyl-CoA mutase, N-terminal domain